MGYVTGGGTSGGGAVTSVAGRTGVVTLAVADVSGAAPLADPTFTGTVTLPNSTVTSAMLAGSIAASKVTGTALVASNNLSDVTAATARTNLGLGTVATHATTEYAPAAGTVGGPPLFVRRTGDSSARNSGNTGTTLTNDDTLLFTVGASDVWWVEAFLLISAANQTMDFQMQWSLPASGVFNFGALGGPSNSLGGYGSTSFANNAIGIRGSGLPLIIGTGTAVTIGLGAGGVYVGGGTSGTVTMQWAQNTADAGNLIMLTNSFLRLTRLA